MEIPDDEYKAHLRLLARIVGSAGQDCPVSPYRLQEWLIEFHTTKGTQHAELTRYHRVSPCNAHSRG